MNQEERVESFLKELTKLSRKYRLEVIAKGTPLLSDRKEGGWIEFGMGLFNGNYIAYDFSEEVE